MAGALSIFGGLTGGGGGAPPPPPPPPPLPQRTDKPIVEAREQAEALERARKGRRATILTSGRGLPDDQLGVTRPEAVAGTAHNLGGTNGR